LAVDDWNSNYALNTTLDGVFIGPGWPPSNVNDAIQHLMADVKVKFDAVTSAIPSADPTLTAFGALSFAANQMAYATGADAFALTALTAFARSLLDDVDAAAMCATLGAIRVVQVILANPGFVKLQLGPTQFLCFAWGTFASSPNTTTPVDFATGAVFPTASFTVVSGGPIGGGASENCPTTLTSGTTGFTSYSARDETVTAFYLSAGY
jgi:hypothetical protein